MDLAGETAVVTGATSGIGRETARALAAEGARVCLLARTESDLRSVAAGIRGDGGTASVHPTDLADRGSVAETVAAVREDEPPVSLLVNGAGMGSWHSILEADSGEAERYMAVPYFGAVNLTRGLLPGMVERGKGRVVNVCSPASYQAVPGATTYNGARYAMRGLTESLAVELASTGVGVTEVLPGKVDTDYFTRNENVEERIPGAARFLRTVSPGEVAAATVGAVRGDRRRVVLPPELKLLLWFRRLSPRLSAKLTAATGWQPGED